MGSCCVKDDSTTYIDDSTKLIKENDSHKLVLKNIYQSKLYNTLIIGDNDAGKHSLMLRFAYNTFFHTPHKNSKLNALAKCGHYKMNIILKDNFEETILKNNDEYDLIIILYDLTLLNDEVTMLNRYKTFLQQISQATKMPKIILIGNKYDLVEHSITFNADKRIKSGLKIAKSLNIDFYVISCLNNLAFKGKEPKRTYPIYQMFDELLD
jgi:GTPase SAR1 family protein